jgi:hypothetical protein
VMTNANRLKKKRNLVFMVWFVLMALVRLENSNTKIVCFVQIVHARLCFILALSVYILLTKFLQTSNYHGENACTRCIIFRLRFMFDL